MASPPPAPRSGSCGTRSASRAEALQTRLRAQPAQPADHHRADDDRRDARRLDLLLRRRVLAADHADVEVVRTGGAAMGEVVHAA